MPLYEHVFLVRQDVSSAQVETLTDQFKTIVGENGGTIAKSEYWGLKSLTYRIKKNRKAHYSLMNIDAPHPAVAEMERQMQLNEDVIRFITLRVDEHEEGPSAMMRSRGGRDRDDRKPGFGGRGGDRDRDGGRGGDRDGGRRDDRPGNRDDRPAPRTEAKSDEPSTTDSKTETQGDAS